MATRHGIAAVAVLVVVAFFVGAFCGERSAAAPNGQQVDGRQALLKMMAAAPETVDLGKAAQQPTDLNVRLTIAIEDQNDNSKKVVDALLNQDGKLVSMRTADEHLAQIVKTKIAAGDVDSCYKRCRHHLDAGNAPKYAVCFYACLAAPD